MGQSIGITVKNVAPDWLLEKIQRDITYVKRNYHLVKDIALIDYPTFRNVVADMNAIMRTCCVETEEQVVFGMRTVDEDLFWKAYVRIICLKVNKQERTFSIMRCMNIRQFWLLREGVLRELKNRNALCEEPEGFVFVTHEECSASATETDNMEHLDQPTSSDAPSDPAPLKFAHLENDILDISNPLTVSTVIRKVDECGDFSNDECRICFDNVIDVSLPCAHSFCSKCINQWVAESGSCPTCRDEVTAPEELWQFTEIPNVAQINRQLIELATGTE